MSVVLLILKIIGFLLLAIVGLLLLVVLLVLMVPVRYRIHGKVDEDDGIMAELRLNWLCHLVSYRLLYRDQERKKKLKIFGIPLKEEGKRAKTKRSRKPRKQKEKKKEKDQGEISGNLEAPKDSFAEDVPKVLKEERNIEQIPEEPPKETSSKAERKGQKGSRLRTFFKKLKALPGMIKAKLETIKEKVRNIREFISRIREEWEDEATRSALKLVWKELKGFLKVLLPRKIKVDAAFSTGKPDITGQALGVISMLPFIYRYRIRLLPDFEAENFYFRGTFDIRGHVHGIHAALLLYRLIKDKNIRGLIQRYRNSQED